MSDIPQDPCGNFKWHIENTKPEELQSFVRGRVMEHIVFCNECRDWIITGLKNVMTPSDIEKMMKAPPEIPPEVLMYMSRHQN